MIILELVVRSTEQCSKHPEIVFSSEMSTPAQFSLENKVPGIRHFRCLINKLFIQ